MSLDQPDRPQQEYHPGWLKDFLVALVFLTRLPVHLSFTFSMSAVGSASRCFPLVGLIVGGVSGAIFLGSHLIGMPIFLAAFLSLSAQILLTGALHEDAIGDVADGFGGGADKAKKMNIMRDSRVGTYAVVTLILVLGMKVSALASFKDPYLAFSVILSSAVVSRGLMVWAMYLLPSARPDGLGASAGKPSLIASLWALAFTVLIPLVSLNPSLGSIALLASIAGAFVLSLIAYRQIGGQTGDVLGSVQQISELSFLIAMATVLN
ncbi:MAG: adenosylcobinamide-GDP ribazoletransferase [Sneathiella sp.]|nr:adenosylcobinamide-GDP ribazoletransferase [Sneathiella sp.]